MQRTEQNKSWATVLAELDRLTLQRDQLVAQLCEAEAELKKFRNDLAAARLERDNARSKVVSLR
jgi:septal ring factor EnvC (AmiA/AmiB activator)